MMNLKIQNAAQRRFVLVIIIIKVNYDYHKISPRILWGTFLKSFITLTILYIEDCQTTARQHLP